VRCAGHVTHAGEGGGPPAGAQPRLWNAGAGKGGMLVGCRLTEPYGIEIEPEGIRYCPRTRRSAWCRAASCNASSAGHRRRLSPR